MQINAPDQEVSQGYLTDLVQKALDRPALQVMDWKVDPLLGGLEWDSAVFRYQGTAQEAGESVPWSLILKAVRSTPRASEPGGIRYWKREALAYQSGLLHRLPGGQITAPASYDVRELPDGSMWIWMEDVKEDIPTPWPIEQYALVARHLGQLNGAYLVGQAFPDQPWVTRNWLRKYVENAAEMSEFIRGHPNHPVVQHMFPGNSVAQILAVWDERSHILDVLENLPQVFCHQDAFRRNLFARGGHTIAVDWGYMGIAPVGAELVPLVAASIGLFEIPVDRVKEMDRLCFEGYLQGLREAGWTGDSKLVRTGYALSLLLRYPIGGQLGELLPVFLNQEGRNKIKTAFKNKSAIDLEKSDPALVAYYQEMIPKALKYLGMRRLLSLLSRMSNYILRLKAGRKR